MTNIRSKVSRQFIGEIDETELACRILEGSVQCARPLGKTAKEALQCLPREDRDALYRSARAVMIYWQECIAKVQSVQ